MIRRIAARTGVVALALTAVLLMTGCVPQSSKSPGGDPTVFMGDLPAPAGLPSAPRLPPYPAMPSNPNDHAAMSAYNTALIAYQKASQAAQKQITKAYQAITALGHTAMEGSSKGLAAWEALFLRAGIPIESPAGSPLKANGDEGFGMPMSDAELRTASALAASPGGLPLSELADMLTPAAAGISAADLTSQLYKELQGLTAFDFAQVFWAVGPGLTRNGKLLTADQVVLSWGQVELLLRRMANESIVVATARGENVTAELTVADSGPSISTSLLRDDAAAEGGHRPCENSENPWSKEILNQTMKGLALGFDKTLEALADSLAEAAEKAGKVGGQGVGRFSLVLTWARPIMALATFLTKLLLLTPNFSLENAPLVRTKDTTPGETRKLDIGFSFDPSKIQTLRECLNLFLAPAGVELPGLEPDPPSDLEVHLTTTDPSVLRVGDGTGRSTSPVTEGTTDANGHVTFTLSGAPQADLIPDKAAPKDLSEGVETSLLLKSNDFWKDMASLPWDALDAAGSGGLTLVPEMLSRFKTISFASTVPVRDWSINADFQVTAIGVVTERSAENIIFPCGSIPSNNSSVKEVGTFASDPVKVTATLLSNPEGNLGDQAFVFVPKGQSFTMSEADESGVRMFPMPVHYSTKKTSSKPGTGEMPDPLTDQSVCSDGVGGGGYSGNTPKPASDCGVHTYDSTLQVTMPKARTLYVAGDQAGSAALWRNCGDPARPFDPAVAAWQTSCKAPTIKGGRIPSINDIVDTSKTRFTVEGSLSCRTEEPGSLQTIDYTWTLDFCRIVDGKPSC